MKEVIEKVAEKVFMEAEMKEDAPKKKRNRRRRKKPQDKDKEEQKKITPEKLE